MKNPHVEGILLSVIVPVYNVKGYVENCVRSVCRQTYKKLEIILVDDGSTDGSGQFCDEMAKKDKRIRVIHKKNGGLVSARKAGAEVATGNYVIAVDGDDWIDENRFRNLVETGLKALPDMVYMEGHYKEYEKESVPIHYEIAQPVYKDDEISINLMRQFAGQSGFYQERRMEFGQWLWCVRREIYCKNQLEINSDICWGEDILTIFSCILDSKSIVCIHEPSYHYVQRAGSTNYRKTNWNENHACLYYRQMRRILDGRAVRDEVLNVAVQYTYHNLLLTNYKKLYGYYRDYLFPYVQVRKGSRIILYGAGNIGVEMVNAIDENPQYEIVAWVDKKRMDNPRSGHSIESLSVIQERTFDFIVVAVLVAHISQSIRQDLIARGVPEEKIAVMQSDSMCMDDLDRIL